jgi:hypothetical protein
VKVDRYLQVFCLALMTSNVAWAQSSPGAGNQEPQAPPSIPAQLEDLEAHIGPLRVRDQDFTIVLQKKRIKEPNEETVVRMEIRDTAGKVSYETSFPVEADVDRFVESARVLEGTQASGILVTYAVEPSTPLGALSYQVFGIFNGKLVPFSKPLSLEGNLVEPEPPPKKVVKTTTEPGRQGDVLQFRVWTGNVFVFIPVLVDWMQARMMPAWRWVRTAAQGMQPQARFKVQADRRPPEEELTFVRLHPDPEEGFAQHVVIKKGSKVEILEAAGAQLWEEEKEQINLSVGSDLWLKVRIDGKEGWIHTQEDFNAIGLPQAG